MVGGMHGKGGACVVWGVCGWGACVAGGMHRKGGVHGERRGLCGERGMHGEGGVHGMPPPPPHPALLQDTDGQYAGGTHPTRMHSCYKCNFKPLNDFVF